MRVNGTEVPDKNSIPPRSRCEIELKPTSKCTRSWALGRLLDAPDMADDSNSDGLGTEMPRCVETRERVCNKINLRTTTLAIRPKKDGETSSRGLTPFDEEGSSKNRTHRLERLGPELHGFDLTISDNGYYDQGQVSHSMFVPEEVSFHDPEGYSSVVIHPATNRYRGGSQSPQSTGIGYGIKAQEHDSENLTTSIMDRLDTIFEKNDLCKSTITRSKNKTIDLEDDAYSSSDPRFDWQRPELSSFLPYIDRERNLDHKSARNPVDDAWIDTGQIARWLQICESNHRSHCGTVASLGCSERIFPRWLIDVNRNCLIAGQGKQIYIALSYVWGRVDTLYATKERIAELQDEGSLKRYESSLLRTVRDAIFLVSELGEEYLWVDQLCIVQDDEHWKRKEIQAMAEIYANAYATIVAAQGNDATTGLKGIKAVGRNLDSAHSRNMQRPYQRATISSATSHPRDLLKIDQSKQCQPRNTSKLTDTALMERFSIQLMASKWYSRGWTFQEQLFSPRKIYFQDDTVNWECHCASFFEAQDLSDPELHKVCSSTQIQTACLDSRSWPDLQRFARLVAVYNQRNLSSHADALNAFEGVLSTLSKVFKGSFISGLPVLFFDAALLWQPYKPVARRRLSQEEAQSSSSSPLPSWSWVGWHGNMNSESWRSGHDYLRNISIRPRPDKSYTKPTSWHTIPTIVWYHSETLKGERRVISSPWREDAQKYLLRDTTDMPVGWTRHAGNEPGTFYFKHESDQDQEFVYPIPLRDPMNEIDYQQPMRSPYLHCRTHRTTQLRVGRTFEPMFATRCVATTLVDESNTWIGAMRLNQPYLQNELYEKHLCSRTYELIELSAGSVEDGSNEATSFDEWYLAECPRHNGIYEFINVMWIERVDGVAYRKAVGRVQKEAWLKCEKEVVDITIG